MSSTAVSAMTTICLADFSIKPSSTPLSNKVSKLLKYPSTFNNPTWRFKVKMKIDIKERGNVPKYSIILKKNAFLNASCF